MWAFRFPATPMGQSHARNRSEAWGFLKPLWGSWEVCCMQSKNNHTCAFAAGVSKTSCNTACTNGFNSSNAPSGPYCMSALLLQP